MVTGKGDVRERQRRAKTQSCEVREGQRVTGVRKETIWNPEDSTPSWLCSVISRIASLMILWTILAPLILIQHLTHYDSHSLEAVSHPSSSQVINQTIFPFISYLFPMMSDCVSFYYSFLFDLSSDSSCSYQYCYEA